MHMCIYIYIYSFFFSFVFFDDRAGGLRCRHRRRTDVQLTDHEIGAGGRKEKRYRLLNVRARIIPVYLRVCIHSVYTIYARTYSTCTNNYGAEHDI